jgi:pimeloyl-ACP methyl ester carboxylesterase
MRKFFLGLCAVIAVLVFAMAGWLVYSTDKNYAAPAADALENLVEDSQVSVTSGDWLVMQPGNREPEQGVIIYPGANCDIRGYAPVMRKLAEAGYLVVAVSMPFDLAIFAPSRANEVRDAFPKIQKWALVGHSMGGAMAGAYAHDNPDKISALIMWDGYPPTSKTLVDAPFPVTHIHRADENGAAPTKFSDQRDLFPSDSKWVGVPGGAHMFFGAFDGGGYTESRPPTIARDAQHEIVVTETLAALAGM